VAEGWKYFNYMSMDYHITPTVEHYACMVDLLGRAGYLDEAESFVKTMPVQANAGVWGALLGACRIHCNVKLGECVAGRLFELEPENAGNYILLANIYATSGQWDKVEEVRKLMKDRGLKTKQGCSWIEINNKVHTFHVRDRSHPQSEEIYAMLESLMRKMKLAGYMPTPSSMLGDME
jgi:pentatricopeptide repeat protein